MPRGAAAGGCPVAHTTPTPSALATSPPTGIAMVHGDAPCGVMFAASHFTRRRRPCACSAAIRTPSAFEPSRATRPAQARAIGRGLRATGYLPYSTPAGQGPRPLGKRGLVWMCGLGHVLLPRLVIAVLRRQVRVRFMRCGVDFPLRGDPRVAAAATERPSQRDRRSRTIHRTPVPTTARDIGTDDPVGRRRRCRLSSHHRPPPLSPRGERSWSARKAPSLPDWPWCARARNSWSRCR